MVTMCKKLDVLRNNGHTDSQPQAGILEGMINDILKDYSARGGRVSSLQSELDTCRKSLEERVRLRNVLTKVSILTLYRMPTSKGLDSKEQIPSKAYKLRSGACTAIQDCADESQVTELQRMIKSVTATKDAEISRMVDELTKDHVEQATLQANVSPPPTLGDG